MPCNCASARPSGQTPALPPSGVGVAGEAETAGDAGDPDEPDQSMSASARPVVAGRVGHIAAASPMPRSAAKCIAGCVQCAFDDNRAVSTGWPAAGFTGDIPGSATPAMDAGESASDPERGAASASSMACRTAWCTSRPSRNRTSILVGWTLTSTRAGSISRYNAYTGWRCPCSTSSYALRAACDSTLSRTKRPLT